MDLLRLSTAGSVDDGKSTLIGRLLYDSKGIFEDQLAAIERTSRRRGNGYVDLALLTDGLRAEREQGITIDVAYRYFATPRRAFIIADTPGHTQYTRNMVTGASTADLAIVLIDARRGVLEQSRRHAVIADLLGVPHLVVAVNKMDLVDWDEATFRRVREDFTEFAVGLDSVRDVSYIPISALHGDNVVSASDRMPWFAGPALLPFLEQVEVASDRDFEHARFPVQMVIRPQSSEHPDYRGYAGRVEGGTFRPGDEVVSVASGRRTRIEAIEGFGCSVSVAVPPMSVTMRLADDLDVSRGDLLASLASLPRVAQELEASICWMHERALVPGSRYALKHTTRWVRAICEEVRFRHDVNTHHREVDAGSLGLNEIGRVRLRTTAPLLYDAYRENRATGSFILADESTNETVAAGMLLPPAV
jgi:bifunctional enzyme CysN/CysC